ncbi:MAG: hypothetical protein RBS68_16535, partial [Anaerolineales bacterium]|nr:hypothetical protein [Anaerolineales bacterium]
MADGAEGVAQEVTYYSINSCIRCKSGKKAKKTKGRAELLPAWFVSSVEQYWYKFIEKHDTNYIGSTPLKSGV